MYYTIKTLLERGYSIRSISRELRVHRRTITKIKNEIEKGTLCPNSIKKEKKLDQYHDFIYDLVEKKLTSILIQKKLKEDKDVEVSYTTVLRYVNSIRQSEVYVPLESLPGEEAQVDFGHMGRFKKDGKLVSVWVFSMQLSNSRYAYYQMVTDQSTQTFIRCHINAFEYFGGVPKTVKIDNLKAAVLSASFYEPIIQTQYSQFLTHYKSLPITARVRRGQDKGKVEAGIKYVKNNFLKGLGHRDYFKAAKELAIWNKQTCNKRLHGTTRKIPEIVLQQHEQEALLPLPAERFQIYTIEMRSVKPNAHVSFENNYYSVPHQYANKKVSIKSTEDIIKIYAGLERIAIHSIEKNEQGEYISQDAHRPPYKQKRSEEDYRNKAINIGKNVYCYRNILIKEQPFCWQRMINGVFKLADKYNNQIVDMAAIAAVDAQTHSC